MKEPDFTEITPYIFNRYTLYNPPIPHPGVETGVLKHVLITAGVYVTVGRHDEQTLFIWTVKKNRENLFLNQQSFLFFSTEKLTVELVVFLCLM